MVGCVCFFCCCFTFGGGGRGGVVVNLTLDPIDVCLEVGQTFGNFLIISYCLFLCNSCFVNMNWRSFCRCCTDLAAAWSMTQKLTWDIPFN